MVLMMVMMVMVVVVMVVMVMVMVVMVGARSAACLFDYFSADIQHTQSVDESSVSQTRVVLWCGVVWSLPSVMSVCSVVQL